MRAATTSYYPVGLMPEGVKLSPHECFEGEHDGESFKEFIAAFEIIFIFLGLKMITLRALFAKRHSTKIARIWYDA